MSDQPLPADPPWHNRRKFLYITNIFSMAVIAYCLWIDSDSRVFDTAVTMAFVLMTSSVGSYVFGAVWQDVKLRDNRNSSDGDSGFRGRRDS